MSNRHLARTLALATALSTGLAFAGDDTLNLVMPGMESSFWVKDVVEVEAK